VGSIERKLFKTKNQEPDAVLLTKYMFPLLNNHLQLAEVYKSINSNFKEPANSEINQLRLAILEKHTFFLKKFSKFLDNLAIKHDTVSFIPCFKLT